MLLIFGQMFWEWIVGSTGYYNEENSNVVLSPLIA